MCWSKMAAHVLFVNVKNGGHHAWMPAAATDVAQIIYYSTVAEYTHKLSLTRP